jgi:hypothetical protein
MAQDNTKSVYQTLADVDCSNHIEKKGKFSYVSWAWAWALVKQNYPDATFEKHVFTDNQNNPLPFMRDTKGYTFVQTSVTIGGHTLSETFPVTDNRNQAIQHPNAFEVNTALQRCLVKTLAFHGLGLSIYAGEDLPVMGEHGEDLNKVITNLAAAQTTDDCDAIYKSNADLMKRLNKSEVAEIKRSFTNARSRIAAQEKQAA